MLTMTPSALGAGGDGGEEAPPRVDAHARGAAGARSATSPPPPRAEIARAPQYLERGLA